MQDFFFLSSKIDTPEDFDIFISLHFGCISDENFHIDKETFSLIGINIEKGYILLKPQFYLLSSHEDLSTLFTYFLLFHTIQPTVQTQWKFLFLNVLTKTHR